MADRDPFLQDLRAHLNLFVPSTNEPELVQDRDIASYYDSLKVFPKSVRPKNLPQNLPMYRADERRNTVETQSNPDLDIRSLSKNFEDIILGGDPKAQRQNAVSNHIKQLYAYARTAGAAKALNLPTVSPELLGALALKEGRSDFGFNEFLASAPEDVRFQQFLHKKYNFSPRQKQFLGMLNYANRVAKKKGVPFAAVWNGLGTNIHGQTGFDYSKALASHTAALNDPRNAQLKALLQTAYSDGQKYGAPLKANEQRDTDPYFQSDPQYEYHTQSGDLRPVSEIISNKLSRAPQAILNWFANSNAKTKLPRSSFLGN